MMVPTYTHVMSSCSRPTMTARPCVISTMTATPIHVSESSKLAYYILGGLTPIVTATLIIVVLYSRKCKRHRQLPMQQQHQ